MAKSALQNENPQQKFNPTEKSIIYREPKMLEKTLTFGPPLLTLIPRINIPYALFADKYSV